VVGGQGDARDEDLHRGGNAGPIEDDGELVSQHVGGPRSGLRLHEHNRMRQGTRSGTGGCQATGYEHAAALQLPGGHGQQGRGHDVVGRTGLEPVLRALLGACGRERGIGVEVGACGAGRGDECGAHRLGENGAGGHQARGQDLDGVGVLAHGDQLTCPGQQVVVHTAGQRQQQVVRRLR
jgi:hypothetical protein